MLLSPEVGFFLNYSVLLFLAAKIWEISHVLLCISTKCGLYILQTDKCVSDSRFSLSSFQKRVKKESDTGWISGF